ncbi:hypothetical protein Tco_1034023 [Tanacetum coccineum]
MAVVGLVFEKCGIANLDVGFSGVEVKGLSLVHRKTTGTTVNDGGQRWQRRSTVAVNGGEPPMTDGQPPPDHRSTTAGPPVNHRSTVVDRQSTARSGSSNGPGRVGSWARSSLDRVMGWVGSSRGRLRGTTWQLTWRGGDNNPPAESNSGPLV